MRSVSEEEISERDVVSARLFDEGRERVFAAFRDPLALAAWWGPEGFSNTFQEFDFRPGGTWRYVMRAPDGAEASHESLFVDIVEPERIVVRHLRPVHEYEATIVLREEGGRTQLTWRMRFESAAECDRVRPFVAPANEQNLDRLQRCLRAAASSTRAWSIRRLEAVDDAQIDGLAAVLIDCVAGGASVSFMHPLTPERAVAFWRRVAQGVASGERALLVAEDGEGLCGTVQLVLAQPENQPHRADLAKMLVHRRARRQGLGAALVRAAEATARDCGKTVLVLDAVTGGDAERLYERLGWIRVGDIPRYALMPQGGFCSTTFFYRNLDGGEPLPPPGDP